MHSTRSEQKKEQNDTDVSRLEQRLEHTYVLSSLEFIDVNIDDLGCGEGLLQWSVVWVVFRRGLPEFPEQQRVLHDPLDWFDE